MNHPSTGADLIGFTLSHAVFRNELPRLAAALAGEPLLPGSAETIEDHLRLVCDHLLRHHQEEDEFHWPLLASRVPGVAALLDILEAEHLEMGSLISGVKDRSRPQQVRARLLQRLTDLVLAQLNEEDRCVVPLLAEYVSAEEQAGSMARSRAKIPADDQIPVLALMLDAASTPDRLHLLSLLPAEVGDRWRRQAAPNLDRVHQVLHVQQLRTTAHDPDQHRPVLPAY
jgi:hypothetical protein